jgi:hypothetical protein
MNRHPVLPPFGLSRRAALGRAGAVAAALGLGGRLGRAAAQEATPAALAGHPLTGTWLALANPPLETDPQFAAPSLFAADGTVLLTFPLTQAGPQGVLFNSASVGTWQADSDRRGHFTAVQVLSDAAGTFLGTTTVDGYPEVSADGQTFIDDGSRVMVTIRDPSGAIVQQFSGAGARPVTAMRMGPGSPGFPAGTPTAGTPAP